MTYVTVPPESSAPGLSPYRTPSGNHPKHRGHLVESVQQRINLSHRVVRREADSRRRRHIHPLMQRPGAVVTNPNSDPSIIKNLADIMRVDTVDHEGDHTRTVLAVDRPDDTDPWTLRETGEKHFGEGMFMGRDPPHSEAGQVVTGRR